MSEVAPLPPSPPLSSLPLSLVVAAGRRAEGENAYGQDGCELPTASQDASLMFMGHRPLIG